MYIHVHVIAADETWHWPKRVMRMCDIIFPYIKAYLLYIFTAKGVVVHHVGAYCIIIVMMAVCSHLH